MKRSCVGKLIFLGILSIGMCSASPIFWPGSGHWYEITSGPMSWTNAQSEATSKGGYLVAVSDSAEQAFLVSTFAPSGGWENFLWIGLWDPQGNGNFVWVNGEQVVYTNWAAGEPNNANQPTPGVEWAVELRTGSFNGEWNDRDGSFDQIYGLIEYDTYIPEPATLLFVGSGLIGLSLIRRRLVRS